MERLKWIVLVLAVLCAPAQAADTAPSEKSIRELLRLTESEKLLDATMAQIDGYVRSAMQQSLNGQTLSVEQQQEVDRILARTNAIFKKEMDWAKLEPMFIRIYRDSFTQQEIDGITAFYRSAAGQALVKKMPLVMQNTMAEMQKFMGPIIQNVMKVQEEEAAAIRSRASNK